MQFNARLTDIFVIHSHFNSEKGKGRVKKRTVEEIREQHKNLGLNGPKMSD